MMGMLRRLARPAIAPACSTIPWDGLPTRPTAVGRLAKPSYQPREHNHLVGRLAKPSYQPKESLAMWNLPAPPGFQGLHPHKPLTVYVRHLPHWRQDGATYFV